MNKSGPRIEPCGFCNEWTWRCQLRHIGIFLINNFRKGLVIYVECRSKIVFLKGWCDILCRMLLTCLERQRMGRVWRQALF